MPPDTNSMAALRSELETARELVEAYRALTREARRELEDERRENARLREQLAAPERPRAAATLAGRAEPWGGRTDQCPECRGVGRVPSVLEAVDDTCGGCNGAGQVSLAVDRACPDCGELRCSSVHQPVVDHARLTIHAGGIREVELSVCPACKQNRPEEQDWRGGMCSACFVAGEVAPS